MASKTDRIIELEKIVAVYEKRIISLKKAVENAVATEEIYEEKYRAGEIERIYMVDRQAYCNGMHRALELMTK